jgi:hypothetical protein
MRGEPIPSPGVLVLDQRALTCSSRASVEPGSHLNAPGLYAGFDVCQRRSRYNQIHLVSSRKLEGCGPPPAP